jgi:deoxyhypusine synthase
MEPVKDLKITKNSSVDDIVRGMRDAGGFTAKNLAIGIDILDNMTKTVVNWGGLNYTETLQYVN